MKKPCLLLVFVALCLSASAQKVFYAYFQSEDQSPFYVKMANKVFNSAAAGYLTISNLKDTTYSFLIGFSSSPAAEKKFNIKVNGSDLGFVLKNLPEGPQLTNLQTSAIIQPETEEKTNVVYETRNDRFSAVLAKAADDPTLLKKPVIVADPPRKKEEVKESVDEKTVVKTPPAEKQAESTNTAISQTEEKKEIAATKSEALKSDSVARAESAAAASETAMQQPEKIQATQIQQGSEPPAEAKEATFKRSEISRYSETSTTEGFGLVFFDKVNGRADTIRLLIPNPKVTIGQKENKEDEGFFLELKEQKTGKPASQATATEEKKPSRAEEKQTADVAQEKSEGSQVKLPATAPSVSPTCTEVAEEKDFFKLRRNMAGKETDEAMIEEARRFFKKQCFTTEQLRHLSALFLTSAGKYQFFDAAFAYVADRQNFASLEKEIRDPYYLKRFKALVGE